MQMYRLTILALGMYSHSPGILITCLHPYCSLSIGDIADTGDEFIWPVSSLLVRLPLTRTSQANPPIFRWVWRCLFITYCVRTHTCISHHIYVNQVARSCLTWTIYYTILLCTHHWRRYLKLGFNYSFLASEVFGNSSNNTITLILPP